MNPATTLERIEEWLAANAPRTHSFLNPPATPADLRQAEVLFGWSLLPELTQLYLWHNGAGRSARPFYLLPEYSLLNLADAVTAWQTWQQIMADDPDNPHRHWFPLATAFTGDFVIVDHATDTRGSVFPVLLGDGARPDKSRPSLAGVLTDLLHAMQTGEPIHGWRVTVSRDGTFDWAAEPRGSRA
jgi:cell wall assembly regulator SMI1